MSACVRFWAGYVEKGTAARQTERILRAAAVCALMVLAVAAFQRNQLWRDPLALWQQNAERIPNNQRAWESYGKYLVEAGRYAEAIVAIEKAAIVEKDSDGETVHRFTQEALLNLIIANYRINRYEKAKQLLESGLSGDLIPLNRAKMLNNYANMMRSQGKYPEAEALYRQAIQVYPQGFEAKINLASLLIEMGQRVEARQLLEDIQKIDPGNSVVAQMQSVLNRLESNSQ